MLSFIANASHSMEKQIFESSKETCLVPGPESFCFVFLKNPDRPRRRRKLNSNVTIKIIRDGRKTKAINAVA